MSALQRMRNERLRITPKMYSGVVAAYARRGNWEGATQMLTRLREKGVPAEISGYNAAMQALASGFQWRGAIQLLSQLESAGLYPGYQTYDSLISVCEMCGQWEKAMAFYERMESELDDEEFERRSSRRASSTLDDVQTLSGILNTTTMLRALKGELPGLQIPGLGEKSIETFQQEAIKNIRGEAGDQPFWDL
uniref:Pentatricopeptide repeat-containing protein-mitochondrial domain-containing protein n=1 Tax=Lotharella oceanica TaxID=641309 RepID=A0A7S2TYN4_9EUKA